MNVRVRILVEHQQIGSWAGATHDGSFRPFDTRVIVTREFPERNDPSKPNELTLERFLNNWKASTYINEDGKLLLHSKILGIEIKPVEVNS